MRKKFLHIALVTAIMTSMLGCSKTNETISQDSDKESQATTQESSNDAQESSKPTVNFEIAEDGTITLDTLGIKASMPDSWKANNSNLDLYEVEQTSIDSTFGMIVSFLTDEGLKESEGEQDENAKEEKKWENSKGLFTLCIVRDNQVEEEEIPELVAGPEKKTEVEKIAEQDGYTYYFCTMNYDDTGLSEESKQKYKALYDDLTSLKDSLQITKPEEPEEIEYPSQITFKTQNTDGNEVTNEIFKNNKITLVNIWGTFCEPCLQEMPDLQEMSEELKEKGIGVVGIVGDTADENGNVDDDTLQLAKTILKEKKITYMNLVMNQDFGNIPLEAFPTSLLVDNNGNIVGDPIIGAISKDEYTEIILKAVEEVQ
jgi:thiol-disulfide isomerase/thioredoxin